MSVLRTIEQKIEGAVERTFGRLFRGHVEPVELARKLAREMEDHKTVSVSRVYVPNEYVIYLSKLDRERLSSFESSLIVELQTYLADTARHEGLTMLSEPRVRMETDADLRIGEYGIACRVVDPPAEPPPPPLADPFAGHFSAPIEAPLVTAEAEPADALGAVDAEPVLDAEPAADVAEAEPAEAPAEDAEPEPPEAPAEEAELEEDVDLTTRTPEDAPAEEPAPVAAAAPLPPVAPPPRPAAPPPPSTYEPLVGVSGTQILSAEELQAAGLAQEELNLVVEGRRHRVSKRVTVIGRSRDCDVVVADSNASRRHAEVRHVGMDYHLVDLGSTNGTLLNGQRVQRQALADGDRIVLGTTEIVVELVA
ncbi:MAG TPA: DUF3662 and FHA domain-containing protein [Miltoncostaeaceae bacterium]|nr:DUF3662 and FHA domain-containing protein [Miltoncostaeaceae bacterium]